MNPRFILMCKIKFGAKISQSIQEHIVLVHLDNLYRSMKFLSNFLQLFFSLLQCKLGTILFLTACLSNFLGHPSLLACDFILLALQCHLKVVFVIPQIFENTKSIVCKLPGQNKGHLLFSLLFMIFLRS